MNDQDFQNNWVDGKTWVIGSQTTGDSSMQHGDVVRFTSSNGVKGVQIVHTADPNGTVDEWATCCWLDGDDLVGVKVFRITLDASAELTCRFVDDPLVPLTIPDPANPAGSPRLVGFLTAALAAAAPPERSILIGKEPSPVELPGNPPSGALRNSGSRSRPQPGGNDGKNHRDTAGAVFVAIEGGPITVPPPNSATTETTA